MGLGSGSTLMKLGMLTDADQVTVDAITLFVALLCACIVIGHLLEENRWFNESVTSLLIGLCTGIVILLTSGGTSSRVLEFDEQLFFNYLLPPIIFNAGLSLFTFIFLVSGKKEAVQVKKKQFFRNFITITMFGVIGTLISFAVISSGASLLFKRLNVGFLELNDYLAIGAILSATDSVCTLQVLNQDATPLLYSLVFGEGVVNDATSVVLFNAIQRLDLSHIGSSAVFKFMGNVLSLFITSTLLGVTAGLLSAYVIKKLYFGRHSTDREVALMTLMAYLSYMMAELFDLSGILTVFFCGIVMSHYTWHNVTESSRVTTKHGFATLSFVAEVLIFVYVGMDALDIEKWRFVSKSPGTSVGVSSVLLILVFVGRAAFVFPFSFLINLTRNSDSEKMNIRQQITIWWAGLMRGAVTMALAYNQFAKSGHTQLPGNAIMITSTITIVLFSTLVIGMMTKPLVRLLLPSSRNSFSTFSSDPSSPKSLTLPLISSEQVSEPNTEFHTRPTSFRMLLSTPANTIHFYWRKFDDAFMRPVFGGRGFIPNAPVSPTDMSVF